MNMQKLSFLLVIPVLFGCQNSNTLPTKIRGSGTVKSETREVQPFDRVSIAGAANVEIVAGQPAATCELKFDDNLLEHVSTLVEDGELKIKFLGALSSPNVLQVKLATPHLSKFTASGSIAGKVVNVDEPRLELGMSGATEIECTGKVETLDIDGSGVSKFNCLALAADAVTIDIAGDGTADVQAAKSLKVDVSGAANIRYVGSPEIEKHVSGTGAVQPMEPQSQQ